MTEFRYTARNREGQMTSATVEASSREALGQALKSQGLLPTSIIEQRPGLTLRRLLPKVLSHVPLLEKLTFIKNLAVTLKAGLPMAKALEIIGKQVTNPHFREVVGDLAYRVVGGKPLWESLGAYPRVFSPLMINMVRVGEESGELEKTLEYLGVQIARDHNLLRRVKGALTYPAVVVIALVIIGYVMFSFVLPRMTEIFKQFNTELPLLTQIIVRLVDIFSQYSLIILLLVFGVVMAVRFWKQSPAGKRFFDKLWLILPVVGPLVKKLNLARFSIILSGLLGAGMSLVEALKNSSETTNNFYYHEALARASDQVKVGVDLVAVLETYPKLFTPMVTQMIQVGEESGTIEKVLAEVSSFYEAEVDDTLKNLTSIIEPVLVIIIGAVVGFLAVGLILPIYNVGQTI